MGLGDQRVTPQEHVEWFKRFAACYLKWSHSNMDRIVKEAIKRHAKP